MSQDTQHPEGATQTVMVESLDDFVRFLAAWHDKQVATLQHMMSIPEGSEAQAPGGEPILLAGDTHKGFVLGLQTALDFLGELPFTPEFEQNPEVQAAQDQLPLEEVPAPAQQH